MRQTVVGVFEQQDEATAALSTLADEQFDPSCVHAIETASIPTLTDIAVEPESDGGLLGHVRHFLSDAFGDSHVSLLYEGMMRRGRLVVSVDAANQPEAVRAELAFVKAGAIDITRRTA